MEAEGPPREPGASRQLAYRAMGVALLVGAFAAGISALFLSPSSAADTRQLLKPAASPVADDRVARAMPAEPAPLPDQRIGADVVPSPGSSDGTGDAPRIAPNKPLRPAPPRMRPRNDFCSPPYDVNEDGIRHYKRQCL
jgi:serine/threonine-protein kinase